MRSYELTFIIKPDVEDEDRASLVEQIQEWIASVEGTVTKMDNWGRRRLAYPIQKYQHGYYVLLNIQVDGENIREIERCMQLSESILRFLTVRSED